jgi:hypothetical protein
LYCKRPVLVEESGLKTRDIGFQEVGGRVDILICSYAIYVCAVLAVLVCVISINHLKDIIDFISGIGIDLSILSTLFPSLKSLISESASEGIKQKIFSTNKLEIIIIPVLSSIAFALPFVDAFLYTSIFRSKLSDEWKKNIRKDRWNLDKLADSAYVRFVVAYIVHVFLLFLGVSFILALFLDLNPSMWTWILVLGFALATRITSLSEQYPDGSFT